MTRVDWLIQHILGDCRCPDAYKDRYLISPHCERCQNEEEAREALLLAYQLGHEEAGTPTGKKIVDANRKLLAPIRESMDIDCFVDREKKEIDRARDAAREVLGGEKV